MARFKCDRCGFDGRQKWIGEHKCPSCGEIYKLKIAIGIDEMTDAEVAQIEEALASYGADTVSQK